MSGESFQFDTNGRCLLCLNANCSKPVDDANTNGHLLDTQATAIKVLCRYLKVDINMILMKLRNFSSSGFQRFVIGGQQVNLSVILCKECLSVTNHFLELFQAFETIRLGLDFCVQQLHDFIQKGDKDYDRIQEFEKRAKTGGGKVDPGDGDNGEGLLDNPIIMGELRREIFEKCSLKLGPLPRVVVNKCDYHVAVVQDLGEPVGEKSSPETPDLNFSSPSSKRATSRLRRKRKRPVQEGWEDKFVQVGDKLECTKCGKLLRDVATFKSHFLKHGNQRHRKCILCGKIFSDRNVLDVHQMLSHTMEYFSCEIPPTVSQEQLEETLIIFVEKARAECIEFGGGVVDHEKKEGIIKIKCPFCEKSLQVTQGTNLRKHFLRFHLMEIVEHVEAENGDKVERETCVKKEDQLKTSLISVDNLASGACAHSRLQIRQRNKADEFRNCIHCGRSFAEYANLRRHLIISHSYKHFEHRIIPPNIVSKQQFEHALAKMMRVKVNPNPGQEYSLTCSVCENGFRDRSRLRMHLLIAHFNQVIEKAVTIGTSHSADKSLTVDTESAPVVDFIVEDGVQIKTEKPEENTNLAEEEEHEITATEPFLAKVEPTNPDQDIKLERDENDSSSGSTHGDEHLPHTVKARISTRRTWTKKIPVKCEFCKKVISSRANLRLHKLQVHPIQLFSAQLPPGVSKSGLNLAVEAILLKKMSNHPNAEVSKPVYECPLCNKTATQRPILKLHILENHIESVAKKLSHQHQEGQHSNNMPSLPLPGSRKCSHCEKYIGGGGSNMKKHEMREHATIIYRDHLPRGISEEDFESALASSIQAKIKVLPKEKNELRAFTECTLCLKRTRNHSSELRCHMLRCHIDEVAAYF